MTKIMPFSTVFSIKFSFFLLFLAAIFLFSGCGGSSTKIEPVSNTDEDSTDADFDGVDYDYDYDDYETEDEEDLDSDDTDDSETSTEEKPARQPTREECINAGGTWDEEESRHCYRDKDCDEKPENAKWSGWYNDTYRQYYENGEWSEPPVTEYNDDKQFDECDFVCRKNYSWDGTECKDLCDPDPCAAVEHSDGTCITTPGIYSCGCADGYRWNDGECVEITSELSLGNICTCQSECYKDFFETRVECMAEGKELFGQDAVYAAAGRCIRKKYSVKETGIENENIMLDNNLKLEWQQTVSGEEYDWETAVNYCKNLEYGGYTDWRTPTPKELLSTLEAGRCDPETTDFYFKDSGLFLTSKLYAGNSNLVWLIENSFGNMSYFSRNLAIISVRCVRGKTIPEDTFTVSVVNGDEIVTDAATGLIWQKGDLSAKRWKEALEYCESLNYAGYSDWRLPNINELASLANYDKYSPASDFPGISQENYWSSTTDIPFLGSALNIFFHTGEIDYASKDTFYYVKCVRQEER